MQYTQVSEKDVLALQRKYEDLLEIIRPNAVGLVDAFDYRDEVSILHVYIFNIFKVVIPYLGKRNTYVENK